MSSSYAARAAGRDDVSAEARQFDLMFDVLSHLYTGVFARGTEAAPAKERAITRRRGGAGGLL